MTVQASLAAWLQAACAIGLCRGESLAVIRPGSPMIIRVTESRVTESLALSLSVYSFKFLQALARGGLVTVTSPGRQR